MCAIIFARGLKPLLSIKALLATATLDAPSDIELEFAAVTVPSLTKAGFNVLILSRFDLKGCSSLETIIEPFLFLTSTGTISQSKVPLLFASIALFKDVFEKLSCSSLVNEYLVAQSSAKCPINFPRS